MKEITIVLLSDIREQRARKQKELDFYTKRKAELEAKLDIIRRELKLTDTLIKIIEKETSANTVSIKT